jgi:NAD(P)-dependent dehydrogenase (short-subunit alcohol dehydrogenase family)
MPQWTFADMPSQAGRTVLVTGANSGLGYVTARQLAHCGAHVVLTARDPLRGAGALARLRAEVPHASVELRRLDLADLESVRELAGRLVADGVAVDVLVNNAGVMMPPRTLSRQGFELQFATNHLGHFALTGLLLDTLRGSDDARVVTVSAGYHKRGTIHFDDLSGAKGYAPLAFYAQSKLANVLFGLELDRRLRASDAKMRSVLAHPGYAVTNLQSTGPTGVARLLFGVGNVLVAQSAEAGALSQLYAATHPDVEGGQFIGPRRFNETRGYPVVVQPAPAATDRELARRLWRLSESLTRMRYDLVEPG